MTDSREPLSRSRILTAALDLADEGGVDAISMRRLGHQLGVEAMSLYNHVANKDDILDGLAEFVLGEIDTPSLEDDWKDGMRRRATSAREVFRRHPWAMGLVERHSHTTSPQRLGYHDAILGVLRDAGFDDRLAMRAFSILDAYIFGFILQELSLSFDDDASLQEVGADLLRQMAESYPHLTRVTANAMAEGYDQAEEFRFGLDLILDALARRRDGEA
jgi:AcrR family transcriptional regulator